MGTFIPFCLLAYTEKVLPSPIDFASYKQIFIRHVMNMQLQPQGFL